VIVSDSASVAEQSNVLPEITDPTVVLPKDPDAVSKLGGLSTNIASANVAAKPEPFVTLRSYGSSAFKKLDFKIPCVKRFEQGLRLYRIGCVGVRVRLDFSFDKIGISESKKRKKNLYKKVLNENHSYLEKNTKKPILFSYYYYY
jgi:hypothetical protein